MIPHLTLCTLRHTAPIPLITEKHLPIPLLPGKVSRPRAERQIDGESVLERAAETSAEMPDLGGDAPASSRIERLEQKISEGA